MGRVGPQVASTSCRHRSGLAALPPAPWRNPGRTGGHTASFPPESLAWRLLGEIVGDPLSPSGRGCPEKPWQKRRGSARSASSKPSSRRVFALLFLLASGFVYIASGSRASPAPRCPALPCRAPGARTWSAAVSPPRKAGDSRERSASRLAQPRSLAACRPPFEEEVLKSCLLGARDAPPGALRRRKSMVT